MRLELTRHARRRWLERVGEPVPGPEELARLVRESLQTQRPALRYTARGYPVKILAHYMHKGLGLTMKVDWEKRKVVTIVA